MIHISKKAEIGLVPRSDTHFTHHHKPVQGFPFCARLFSTIPLIWKGLIIALWLPVAAQELPRLPDAFSLKHQPNPEVTILIRRDSWMLSNHSQLSDCSTSAACFQEYPAPGIGPFIASHPYYLIDRKLILTTPGSGLVYQAEPDSITRIDRSFDHRAQQGAIEFLRNDTIWRHGGYAAWSAHSVITYFDTKAREWEVLRPLTGSTPPPALWNHRFMLDGDSLWVFGGYVFQEENPKSGKANESAWLFNFRSRAWTRIGLLSPDLSEIEQSDNCLIRTETGNHLAFYNGIVAVLDFKANRFTIRRTKKQAIHHIQGVCPFIQGGRIYTLNYSSPHIRNQSIYAGISTILSQDSLDRFLTTQPTEWRPIFLTGEQDAPAYALWITALAVLGLMAAMLALRKKRNPKVTEPASPVKLLLIDNGLMHQDTLHPLEPLHIAIIRLLLSATEEVNTNHIMELVQNPNLDYTHNLRLKSQVIVNINVRIRSILNLSYDPITTAPSGVDRRVRTYTIDKSLFA